MSGEVRGVRAVWFQEVEVLQARGIRHGEGFSLTGLGPGINLVSGSNGSGKSTTALAIQELLWPGETGLVRPSLRALLRDGDVTTSLQVEAGFVSVHRDGHPVDVKTFAPPESRLRHHLALPELLRATDRSFAKRVADAARGGYDLTAAGASLGFTLRPSMPQRLNREVLEANRHLRDAQQAQEELVRREAALERLGRELEAARGAGRELAHLELLEEWWNEVERCGDLEARLRAFPPGMERLRGDELERLEELRDDLRARQEELRTEQQRRDEAEAERRRIGLPDGGLQSTRLAVWEGEAGALRDLEARLMELTRTRRATEAQMAQLREDVGPGVTDGALERLDREARAALEELARGAESLRREGLRLRERRRELEAEAPLAGEGDLPTPQTAAEGMAALARWLQSPPPPRPDPTRGEQRRLTNLLWVSAALVAILFVVLAVVSHPAWALGLLITLVLILAARRSPSGEDAGSASPGPGRAPADERAIHRQSFLALGLPAPEAWDEDGVAAHLQTLRTLLEESTEAERRARELRTLIRSEEEHQGRGQALAATRAALEAQLGIPLGGGGLAGEGAEWTEADDRWLPDLVRSVAGWREARARWVQASEEVTSIEAAWEERLQRLVREIPAIPGVTAFLGEGREGGEGGAEPGETLPSAAALLKAVTELRRLEDRRAQAVRDRDEAARRARGVEDALRGLKEREGAFWAGLGLDEGEEAALKERLSRHGQWNTLRTELMNTRARRDGLHQRAGSPDPDTVPALAHIRDRQEAARREAERVEELMEEISSIRAQVGHASSGHTVSERLAHRDTALEALSDELARASAQVAGAELLEFIRAEESERSRPAVLRRATHLLARFTRGLLALEVDESSGEAEFRVRRGDGPLRSLDELSGGERIQTLMAVRLAFVEEEESAALPLLLDEALATSDDHRITRIVDTVVEIARQGRQVFCFTAQPSEVAKWKVRLEDTGVPFRHLDLDEIRGRERVATLPPTLEGPPTRTIPAPLGDDRETYGRRLAEAGLLPGVDPWAPSADGLHLWHLMDDVSTLHRLLTEGVHHWGGLLRMGEAVPGFLADCGVGPEVLELLGARARAVERASELWRIGRARSVNREVLSRAQGVSDVFLDRVVELAAECGGDGAELMARLDAGELARWRQSSSEQLREWLETEGYLDPTPRLTAEELYLRLLEAVRRDVEDGRLETGFLRRLVHTLIPDG